MIPITFEWQGVSFRVRPLTIMQRDMLGSVYLDVGKPLLEHYGIDGFENMPMTLDRMFSDYVKLMMTTDAPDKDLPFDMWGDWFVYAVGNSDKVAEFHQWLECVTANEELFSKWRSAYDAVNLKAVSKDAEKKEPSTNGSTATEAA